MFADFDPVLSVDEEDNLPRQTSLAQNYPNPFNPSTNIQFNVEAKASVTLSVFNVLGQHIKTLIDGPVDAGSTTVSWDATDDSGNEVASGVYLYRLVVDQKNTQTKKMLLLR